MSSKCSGRTEFPADPIATGTLSTALAVSLVSGGATRPGRRRKMRLRQLTPTPSRPRRQTQVAEHAKSQRLRLLTAQSPAVTTSSRRLSFALIDPATSANAATISAICLLPAVPCRRPSQLSIACWRRRSKALRSRTIRVNVRGRSINGLRWRPPRLLFVFVLRLVLIRFTSAWTSATVQFFAAAFSCSALRSDLETDRKQLMYPQWNGSPLFRLRLQSLSSCASE